MTRVFDLTKHDITQGDIDAAIAKLKELADMARMDGAEDLADEIEDVIEGLGG